jgi:hypothetical protein
MVVPLCVVMEGWGTKEEVTRAGCAVRLLKAGNEGTGVGGCAWVRRAFVTASLPLLIARHGVVEVREMPGVGSSAAGERCDPLARSGRGPGGAMR